MSNLRVAHITKEEPSSKVSFLSCQFFFSEFKITLKLFFCKKGVMQLFSANAIIVFSKKISKFIFDPERPASKVAGNQPRPFYFTVQSRPQPRIDFSYDGISGPDICSLICAVLVLVKIQIWVDFTMVRKIYL